MGSSRSALLASVLGTVLVAGCASTVGGTAQPNVAAIGALSQTSTSSSQTPTSPTTVSSPSSGAQSSVEQSATATESATPVTTPSTTVSEPTTESSESASTAAQSSENPGSSVYPTTPLKYNKTASTKESANLLEARRIAGYLVVPTFIDASYTKGGNLSTLAYKSARSMSNLFPAPMASVAQRAGMLTGFSSARSDSGKNGFVVAAFEFGSAAQAKAAVPAFVAAAANKENDTGKAVVPGFPAAAGWYGDYDGASPPYFHSFLAQGRMVLYLYISGPRLNSPQQQSALAAKTFTAQTASMGKYVPTAPDKFMQLPVDPDGLLAHTLPNSSDEGSVNDGIYSAAGQLHYDTDPIGTRAVFTNAGVDMVADDRASVYRARDANGATLVQTDFIAYTQSTDKSMQPYTLTADVKDAKCLQQPLSSFYYCVGTQGRYAFEISARNEADINAAMTAQIALLTGF